MAFAPSMPIAAGTAGGGMGINMDLLMYFLAGMGGRLGGQGSWQEALGGMTQQAMAAKSQKALEEERMLTIRKMLAGDPTTDIPEGGKVTYDAKGMTLNMPTGAPGGRVAGTIAPTAPAAPTPTPTGVITDDIRKQYINPLPSPLDVSSASLVGLTPQDVSRALTGAINVESLRQTVFERRAARADVDPLDRLHPVRVPGVGQVTNRQWTNLPVEVREYSIYVNAAKNLGDTDIMTKREWEMTDPTEKERFTRAVMADPELMKAAKELMPPGVSITLEGKLREARGREEVKAQAKVMAPDFYQSVQEDLMKDFRKWRSSKEAEKLSESKGIAYEEARSAIQKAKVREAMDKRVRQAFRGMGKITRDTKGWYLDGELIVRDPYYVE